MKIVMQRNVFGGYDCGPYEIVHCFNYESTEALICDFEKALKDGIKVQDDWYEWMSRRPPNPPNFTFSATTEEQKQYDKWQEEKPGENIYTFVFLGEEFDISDFRKSKNEISMPNVFSLEEWFEEKISRRL